MGSDYCTGGMITPNFECGGPSVRIRDMNPVAEKKRTREITITPLDYGFVLKVGCKTIALDSPQKLLFGLKKYLANPDKVETEFLEGKFKFEK